MTSKCQCAGCRAFRPLDSAYRQSVAVDEASIDAIDALSRPYEYVEALRVAQGGRCTCGNCARSIQRLSLYDQFMLYSCAVITERK